jgi:hypothetical protein
MAESNSRLRIGALAQECPQIARNNHLKIVYQLDVLIVPFAKLGACHRVDKKVYGRHKPIVARRIVAWQGTAAMLVERRIGLLTTSECGIQTAEPRRHALSKQVNRLYGTSAIESNRSSALETLGYFWDRHWGEAQTRHEFRAGYRRKGVDAFVGDNRSGLMPGGCGVRRPAHNRDRGPASNK